MRILISYICYLLLSFFIQFNNNCCGNLSISDYNFRLSIPSIDLNVIVPSYGSKDNDVNKGVYLAKDYNFDTFKGSIVIASHSGSSPISFFKNLELLKMKDVVIISKGDFDYYFEIYDFYKINKTGKFKYKDNDKLIYLVTCDKNNRKKQLVYVGKLEKIVKKSTFF